MQDQFDLGQIAKRPWFRRVPQVSLFETWDPTPQFSSLKIASIVVSNNRASLKASGRLGSNFPVSMAFTDCRETSNLRARSACDHSRSARNTRSRLLHLYLAFNIPEAKPVSVQNSGKTR